MDYSTSPPLLSRRWFWIVLFLAIGLTAMLFFAFLGLILGLVYLFGGFVLHIYAKDARSKAIAQSAVIAGGILIALILIFGLGGFILVENTPG